MALLYCYLTENPILPLDLMSLFSGDEETRKKERSAAVKIQTWFRSLQVQHYMRHLHQCAIKIQRVYRGFVGRRVFEQHVQNKAKQLRQNFYNKMATLIQSQWRGFYVRKYKLNFYARRDYLMALKAKNEIFREKLQEFSRYVALEKEHERKRNEMEEDKLMNRKMHYLLSTEVCRGIYNSPKAFLGKKELLLRQSKPLSSFERNELYTKQRERFLNTVTGIPRYSDQDDLKDSIMKLKSPNIKTVWPQGPFRSPKEVRKQRLKKLQPTLRVTTEYKSEESSRILWRNDDSTLFIADEKFFSAAKPKYTYSPSLIASTRYGSLSYGTQNFRSYSPDKIFHKKPFQCVVSPIPIFDDIGKKY